MTILIDEHANEQELHGDGEEVQGMDVQGRGSAVSARRAGEQYIRDGGAVYRRDGRRRKKPLLGQAPGGGERLLPPL